MHLCEVHCLLDDSYHPPLFTSPASITAPAPAPPPSLALPGSCIASHNFMIISGSPEQAWQSSAFTERVHVE